MHADARNLSTAPADLTADAWMDALPQAVLLFGGTGGGGAPGLTVTRLNAAAVRLWGVPQGRAAGRPLLEVVRRHTLEALAERGVVRLRTTISPDNEASQRTFGAVARDRGMTLSDEDYLSSELLGEGHEQEDLYTIS